MAPPNSSMLATLSRSQGSQAGSLTHRVKDLPNHQFISLLDQITGEFQHFLHAIDMINNESLETMLEQILEAFTLKIGQILCADRTTIFMVDQEKQELWSKIAQGDGEDRLEIRVPVGQGIAGYVAAKGEPLNIADAYTSDLFNKQTDIQTGYRTRSILCMPVFNKTDCVVAVVQLLNKQLESGQSTSFDAQDERSFREFASSIGIILESCNSFYVAARNQKGVSSLLKAISSLEQSLDLEKTLQSVMDEARDLMNADRSTLWLLDQGNNKLWTKVRKADSDEFIDLRIPADRGIVGHVASTGETLNIPDAYEDPRFDPASDQRTGYRTNTILCMPVFNSSGELIAVTQLINKKQGVFNSSDEEFMKAFNIQSGIALENAKLFENVLVEKQYQKDMLQSLSDAVISTDMDGHIVTINDAALELLGCPEAEEGDRSLQLAWEQRLIQRPVWDIISVDKIRFRLEDSLETGAKHYVPEQTLRLGLWRPPAETPGDPLPYQPAIADSHHPDDFWLWGERHDAAAVPQAQVHLLERSINLTVNPLTNPEGSVRGGLLVLEDISQEKRMKTTLYRYMTPGVAERVMALGDDGLMRGERREVSVLFSDIRGYTTLTENLEADKVVEMLNAYFETMVEAVFNCEGTLDKFIGDAIMAVYGAPLPLENHGLAAVQSALDMRARLEQFNAERAGQNQPKIRIGIGISSGEVVSGNIGSQRKMEYTVIGDGVNLSSRLEGVTKQYGCDIVISEYTYELCKDQIWVRELDRTRVKGKANPVNIYELIGDRSQPLDDQSQEFLHLYQTGRAAYTAMDFERAIRIFQQADELRPGDRAVDIHVKRANAYLINPPPDHWDGVHTMTTK